MLNSVGGFHSEPVPELLPELASVVSAYGRLGRDMGGLTLQSEQAAWLDQHHITDQGERDAYGDLWHALDSEHAAIQDEKRRAREEERQ